MAKLKTSKGEGALPNKLLHNRVSYLYQAAAYLAAREQQTVEQIPAKLDGVERKVTPQDGTALSAVNQGLFNVSSSALSRKLLSDLRSVSLKTQIRLSPAIKHTICKRCDIMLIEGSTCINMVENKSKGGRKPWADVLVRRCNCCGYARRFPVEFKRQSRRPRRPHTVTDIPKHLSEILMSHKEVECS